MHRTLFIGLDGATFTVLDDLFAAGEMPFLRDLVGRGARAPLRSTPHPLTPPAWTSLITGRSPGAHGVFDFVRVDRLEDQLAYTLATAADRECETIWSVASRAGATTHVFNFPISYPAEPIAGVLVPGFIPWRHLSRAIHPRGAYQQIKSLPGFDPKELSVDWESETKAIQALPDEAYEAWIDFHIRRERQWFSIFEHFVTSQPVDLPAIVFDGVDKLQHTCWRHLDPATPPAPGTRDAAVRERCLGYFRTLDDFIRRLVEQCGPDARVFIASDHGFGPSDRIFHVNQWLADEGFLAWAEGVGAADEERLSGEGHRSHTMLFDWSGTRACALTASSNGIFLRPDLEETAPQLRAEIRTKLLAIRDPVTAEPLVTDVLERETTFAGPHGARGADLTLVLRDHGFVSVLPATEAIKVRPRVIGTHYPDGVLIAAGPGIRAGANLTAPLSILEVAPALLYSLGLPIPADLERDVPRELFTDELLSQVPVKRGPPTRGRSEAGEPAALSREEEQIVYERLKALGYME